MRLEEVSDLTEPGHYVMGSARTNKRLLAVAGPFRSYYMARFICDFMEFHRQISSTEFEYFEPYTVID